MKPDSTFAPLLTLFGVSMGFLEAIVAIYLRQLYYPGGFEFPLVVIPSRVLFMECIREMTTIIMLAVVGIVAGKNRLQRLSSFLYAFALWDIVYYAGLKLFLHWPPSWFTWDVLFLIPVVWVGPVLAPIICSCTMIMLGGGVLIMEARGYRMRIKALEWFLCFAGAFAIFVTFIWDYSKIILQSGLLSQWRTLAEDEHFRRIISTYKPVDFHWGWFITGEGLILCA